MVKKLFAPAECAAGITPDKLGDVTVGEIGVDEVGDAPEIDVVDA